ncbi:hypothetical protein FN846DRAFT_631342 [Sphaerosporella brunnea]|uniref:Uncharacterized protein n=1 Tax=Sphaerosporella brunnea TaxID=1250544 RepID=A0A5J5EBB3_9PEZI|nr:hypothetical protein FN846DRAFT_631342 [Sphaerosporella brunnea]
MAGYIGVVFLFFFICVVFICFCFLLMLEGFWERWSLPFWIWIWIWIFERTASLTPLLLFGWMGGNRNGKIFEQTCLCYCAIVLL